MPSKIVKSTLPGIKEELHYYDGPFSDYPSMIVFYDDNGVAVKETRHVDKDQGESYISVIAYDVNHQVYSSVKIIQGKVVHSSDNHPVTDKTGLHSYSKNNKGCPPECATKNS